MNYIRTMVQKCNKFLTKLLSLRESNDTPIAIETNSVLPGARVIFPTAVEEYRALSQRYRTSYTHSMMPSFYQAGPVVSPNQVPTVNPISHQSAITLLQQEAFTFDRSGELYRREYVGGFLPLTEDATPEVSTELTCYEPCCAPSLYQPAQLETYLCEGCFGETSHVFRIEDTEIHICDSCFKEKGYKRGSAKKKKLKYADFKWE